MKQILFVVGSSRKGSFNRQLAEKAADLLAGKAQVRFLSYDDVPMFNQDIEWPTPDAVTRVRGEIASADGLWIFTPEYNQNMTPLELNLLDWMSRPMEQGSSVTAAANQVVALAGAGGAQAAAGALKNLKALVSFIKMQPVGECVGVPIGKGYGTGVLEVSDDDMKRLQALADALMEAVEG